LNSSLDGTRSIAFGFAVSADRDPGLDDRFRQALFERTPGNGEINLGL
jgi:hypothetical protein